MAVLPESEVRSRLGELTGWDWVENAIRRVYSFDSFTEAMGFVFRVAVVAEAAGHHPDVLIEYNRVTLTLSTHSEGGVTQRDMELAARLAQ